VASNMDLKVIKRRVFAASLQDGLWELALGLSLALTGCLLLVPDTSFILWYLPWVLMTMFLPAAKKRYVAPRVGYVSLAPKRKSIVGLTVALTLTFLLGLVVFLLFETRSMPGWLDSSLQTLFEFEQWAAVIGVFLAGMLGLSALRSGTTRFYAFALLSGVGALVVSVLSVSPGMRATLLFVGAGSVMMVSGVIVFAGFLGRNPLPAEDGADGRA